MRHTFEGRCRYCLSVGRKLQNGEISREEAIRVDQEHRDQPDGRQSK